MPPELRKRLSKQPDTAVPESHRPSMLDLPPEAWWQRPFESDGASQADRHMEKATAGSNVVPVEDFLFPPIVTEEV